MTIDERSAVVDNDFAGHLADSKLNDARLIELLNIAFSKSELTAVMHPLVYEKELLKTNRRIMLLFQALIFQKAEFNDIFQNDSGKRTYYILMVKELYKALTGKVLDASGDKVLSHWVRKSSLGEVHSLSMCLVCNCGIFLSDDSDSKKIQDYIENKVLVKLNVYDRTEFLDERLQDEASRSERRSLTHIAK